MLWYVAACIYPYLISCSLRPVDSLLSYRLALPCLISERSPSALTRSLTQRICSHRERRRCMHECSILALLDRGSPHCHHRHFDLVYSTYSPAFYALSRVALSDTLFPGWRCGHTILDHPVHFASRANVRTVLSDIYFQLCPSINALSNNLLMTIILQR